MDDLDFDYELFKEKYGIDLKSDDDVDIDFENLEGFDDLTLLHEVQTGAADEQAQEKPETQESASRLELYDWLQCIVSAILCGILIFVFIGRVIGVDGSSMLNTLSHRDTVIMSNLFYTPKYGDVVVFKDDGFDRNKPLVKRVIATEGQTIDIDFDTGDVLINGRVIVEDYIREPTAERIDVSGPVTVPKGCVFVMGDNRNESTDSRSDLVGMVDTRQILGKVLVVLIPGKNFDESRSWNRIGSVYKKDS
ncbi:MAG: signal peptidase I [Clostridiales bacterium]|nr:signal peptidase I [Clostridiales bacterium]